MVEQILRRSGSLTDLDLSANLLQFQGAKVLAAHLAEPGCRLSRLALAENNVSAVGAAFVGRALQGNIELRLTLDMAANNLSEAAQAQLGKIAQERALEVLL